MKCLACGNDISGDSSFCSKCGAPVNPDIHTAKTEEITQNLDTLSSLSFARGEKFTERYRILEEVGQGGMGKVYKAEDLELGSIVALKMIHPELLKDERMLKRFKKEILLAREITHENVVRIHDFGKKGHIQFISMEYIEGKNLKEWLENEERLDLKQTVDFFRQICRGLQYAHKKGIVHRDLKPQNIMVDKNGKATVTDFGLAKTIETKDLSQSGTAIGTPEYISPEQALGDDVTPRADIYSLGLIIYELITGIPPFHSSTAYGYLHKHAYSRPKAPSNLNRQISPFLEAIVLKCLRKNPNDRYASTEDILLDLDDERIFTPTSLVQYWARRLPKYLGIAAVMVLFALIFHYLFLRPPAPEEITAGQNTKKTIAVMYFENMTGDEKMDHWRKAFSELLINDLSQSKYLNVVSGDRLYEILSDMNLVNASSYSAKTLKAVAERANASYIVRGTYARDQKELRLNIDLKNMATGRSMGTDQVACRDGESYFDMVDRVTDHLKPRLQLTDTQIAGDINRSVGQITTTSPEALKYYIEARELSYSSKYQESIEKSKKAIEIDPEFAMAYKNMAGSYSYLGNLDKYREYLKKSLSLVNRVSLRERYLIEGFSENVLNDSPQKAIEKFRKLLETYPDDIETRTLLGAVYRNFEEWDLMKEEFEKIIKIDNKAPWAHFNLVLVLCSTGKYHDALELITKNPDAFPNKIVLHNFLATIYLTQHNRKKAFNENKKSLQIDPNSINTLETKTQFHLIYGENHQAEKTIHQIISNESPMAKILGHYLKCHLYLHQGKIQDCLSEIELGIQLSRQSHQKNEEFEFILLGVCTAISNNLEPESFEYLDRALKLSSQINRIKFRTKVLHFHGLACLKFNRIEEANGVIEQIVELQKRHNFKKISRIFHHLNSEKYLLNGDFDSGLNSISQSISLLNSQFRDTYDNHALYLDTLATLYFKKGDYKKSAKTYKQIIDLTTGRLNYGDIYARSFYWLGRISQVEGNKKNSIVYYEKFLDIWKDADATIPELSDVRKKIIELKKS